LEARGGVATATVAATAEAGVALPVVASDPRAADLVLRLLDVLFAGAALLVLSPLLALVWLAIAVTAGRPVLYRGTRVGRFGRTFKMLKFRTLRPDCETRLGGLYGAELTRCMEDEITPVGRALRATHVDELPQLWNVLRGDMSLVGPRPLRPLFLQALCVDHPQGWQRLVVRPGMTGFAQLRMTRETTWEHKLSHDLEWVADRGVRLYLLAVATTAWRLLTRPLTGRPAVPPVD